MAHQQLGAHHDNAPAHTALAVQSFWPPKSWWSSPTPLLPWFSPLGLPPLPSGWSSWRCEDLTPQRSTSPIEVGVKDANTKGRPGDRLIVAETLGSLYTLLWRWQWRLGFWVCLLLFRYISGPLGQHLVLLYVSLLCTVYQLWIFSVQRVTVLCVGGNTEPSSTQKCRRLHIMLLTVCSISLRWCIDTVLLPHPMMLPVMLSIYVSDVRYILCACCKVCF